MKKKLSFLSFLGIADSLYLSLPYISRVETVCSINDINTCDIVTTSKYAKTFFDIPNAFLGVMFFTSLFIIFLYWEKVSTSFKKIKKLVLVALLSSLTFFSYLIYIQTFIIKEYCLYCILSAILTLIIFIIYLREYKK